MSRKKWFSNGSEITQIQGLKLPSNDTVLLVYFYIRTIKFNTRENVTIIK